MGLHSPVRRSSEHSYSVSQVLLILSLSYNGFFGVHDKVTEFVKDTDCLVCGSGVLIELDTSITLKTFIETLEENPKLQLSKASVTYRGTNLYTQAEMTRANLTQPLFELMDKTPMDTVHVTGMTNKNDKKMSSLRKLRVSFKGVDGISDMDTTAGT